MTPKEKARELRDKMKSCLFSDGLEDAKRCALIVVEEMIKEVDNYKGFGTWAGRSKYIEIYWQEVKSELESL